MVYFWQKQFRHHRLSSPKTAISPLISAATTAADTALAAVVSAKSEQKVLYDAKDVRTAETTNTTTATTTTTTTPGRGDHAGTSQQLQRGSNLGESVVGGGGGEGNLNSSSRGPLSSPGCRGHSSAMTNKIQSLVLDKLSEYARRKQESNRRRVAERELDSLNLKIDKLLSKMDDGDVVGQAKLRQEEECVVCLAAPATMKTFPCGHRVVCRKCLIKTMQVAISQRCLPLRCVICRNRILSLQHSQDSDKSSAICLSEESNNKTVSSHSNVANSSHSTSRIIRSNTTPIIVEQTSFPTSISSSSPPVSQQAFVQGQQQQQEQQQTPFSTWHAPSTSHGAASNGPSRGCHVATPAPFQTSQTTYVLLQKKCNNKSVKRLLGTR